jgi:hypothetical protein
MPSFQISITPSRRAAGRFVTRVRRAVQKMYAEAGISQSEIARAIGVHRSVISRQLRGREDISLSRVGEFAWAMGRVAEISFLKPAIAAGANIPPAQTPVSVKASNESTTVAPPQSVVAVAKAA